jgi:dihydroorotate dehydrogenase (NAD+) catalytic subunit|tara:strand:- start:69 stop:1004 length:936 start_codon:yes stop_codon:yes gene_type:complete
MVDMRVNIGGIELTNPVMPGSGTIAEGIAKAADLSLLGAVVTKTITKDLREGNPPPRVAELPNATLFSIGIPSKGPEHFINTIVPFYQSFNVPLIASISADTADDFAALAKRISVPGVSAIEANISCPNLKKNGEAFAMSVQATRDVISAMKAATDVPIWAKLSPNVGDIAEIARSAEAAGADALVCANAMLAMGVDVQTRLPKLATITGGITGAATKPIILRMAYQCVEAVSIPVVGCGGIMDVDDALEYMLAGCTAVQVGTANFISVSTMSKIIAGIDDYCTKHGFAKVADVVGAMGIHEPPIIHAGRL